MGSGPLAHVPAAPLHILAADGWHLAGAKPFCSGSTRIDRALVTAECDDGYRLFDISVAENVVGVHPGSWPAVGMADSLSDTLDFGGPPVPTSRAVGPPNFYLDRPGFWFGRDRSRGLLVRRRPWSRRARAAKCRPASIGARRGRARTCRRPHRPHAPGDRAGGEGDRCRSRRPCGRGEATGPCHSSRGAQRSAAGSCALRRGGRSAASVPRFGAGPASRRSLRVSGPVPRPPGRQPPRPYCM